MNFSQFYQKIQTILEAELPFGTSIIKEGCDIAKDIEIGRTAFMELPSSAAFRQRATGSKGSL
jgi:hypothetical protein